MSFPSVLKDLEEDFEREGRLTVFMLGATDVGKTFTAVRIANAFLQRSERVAVVDADIGQSDIGPPCCVGVGVLHREIRSLREVPPHSLFFVGSTSPNGCMRESILGTVAGVRKARELADVVIVDSTGWVFGNKAKMFKLLEIGAVEPSSVLAIEREEGELQHILSLLPEYTDARICILRASAEAKRKCKPLRRRLREEAFNRYFRNARNRRFDISLFERSGCLPVVEEGSLLGLFTASQEEEALGIGILRKIDEKRGSAVVLTPVEPRAVKRIKVGKIKLWRSKGRLREVFSVPFAPALPPRDYLR